MIFSTNSAPASPPGGNESVLDVQGPSLFSPSSVGRDLAAGLVVFLVALPLCLGVALASNAPLFSGLLAIVGGILVGMLSGSQTQRQRPGRRADGGRGGPDRRPRVVPGVPAGRGRSRA